ncbi:MAG: rRNA maturation RNase YbeY [Actinomycetota bacterium]|nr:rRNA maturation RNase YbeY [Actinomycetota bacterium]
MANEQEIPLDHDRLSAVASHTLTSEDVEDEAELSVLVVTADHMKRLNSHFAGENYATDVLAFPMMEEDEEEIEGPQILGDVVVCAQVAQDNAAKAGHSLAEELDLLVVHGTLHLLGYDHQGDDDRAEMEGRQREILASFDTSEAS